MIVFAMTFSSCLVDVTNGLGRWRCACFFFAFHSLNVCAPLPPLSSRIGNKRDPHRFTRRQIEICGACPRLSYWIKWLLRDVKFS
ncbi:hypothetical protein DM02DRAFT_85683 [Periconia macrospinosa]|uniref:Uncharacterized protein n=1 Tax=Periconia macrospinosa TaxID=97972 RepID=A0A2V1E6C5_9PLEO|nr:hypothetical protein DM02DRAFT_85683 [Periconia macrospinosa]